MNKNKIILHLCADMGTDSRPYQEAGYDVRLIGSSIGIQNYHPPENVYGIIANPPCTQFSFAKSTGKPRDMQEGMKLVAECLRIIWESQYKLKTDYAKITSLKFWVLENPKGLLQRFLGIPVFEYHPWEFGSNYKKATDLWGNFVIPKKIYTKCEDVMTEEEIARCKTNSRKLPTHEKKDNRRSICCPNFAEAFFKANR